MADWKFSKRHPACVTCQREFSEGERHFSRIELGDEGIRREDVCSACWPKDPDPEWVWWRSRHEVARRTGLAVDWEVLERVFHMLGERDAERLAQLRYLLSLMLVRKRRLLLVRAVRRGDGEALVLRRPRRQEEIEVATFDLEPERMDELRSELQVLFEGEELEAVLAGEAPTAEGAEPVDDDVDDDADEPLGTDAPVDATVGGDAANPADEEHRG
ncbi:MAG: hypothetical protein R3F34_16845 [Planctomycetota bacterium]